MHTTTVIVEGRAIGTIGTYFILPIHLPRKGWVGHVLRE